MQGPSFHNGDVQEMVFHTWHKQNAEKKIATGHFLIAIFYLLNEIKLQSYTILKDDTCRLEAAVSYGQELSGSPFIFISGV